MSREADLEETVSSGLVRKESGDLSLKSTANTCVPDDLQDAPAMSKIHGDVSLSHSHTHTPSGDQQPGGLVE